VQLQLKPTDNKLDKLHPIETITMSKAKPKPSLPTDEEWEGAKSQFEDLERANYFLIERITAGVKDKPNCVGVTLNDPIYADDIGNVGEMKEIYAEHGFVPCDINSPDALIIVMARNTGGSQPDKVNCTHAYVKLSCYNLFDTTGMPDDLWETKNYPYETFTHGKFEVNCEMWGAPVIAFTRN